MIADDFKLKPKTYFSRRRRGFVIAAGKSFSIFMFVFEAPARPYIGGLNVVFDCGLLLASRKQAISEPVHVPHQQRSSSSNHRWPIFQPAGLEVADVPVTLELLRSGLNNSHRLLRTVAILWKFLVLYS